MGRQKRFDLSQSCVVRQQIEERIGIRFTDLTLCAALLRTNVTIRMHRGRLPLLAVLSSTSTLAFGADFIIQIMDLRLS
jgi:hypothetical protein